MSAADWSGYLPSLVWRRLCRDGPEVGAGECDVVDGAVLLADITGFTTLTARFTRGSDAGAELLSCVLNDYFGKLMTLMAVHGGEPLKFAGDALLALWPAPAGDLRVATHRAAACALAIQELLYHYDAGHGTRLSLRVSIAQGRVRGAYLRAASDWYFVFGGAPIDAAARVQQHAGAGDVVLAPCAHELLPVRAQVLPLDPSARAWRLYGIEPAPPAVAASPCEPAPSPLGDAYIPGPIRQRLTAGQGQWLAELRQVSVLFVRLPGVDAEAPDWSVQLQHIVDAVSRLVHRWEAALKEIVADDLGCCAVIVFGLPPFSHEDDASRCVRAALDLQSALQRLGLQAPIGLSSGRCFCGLIGSELRREHAVIGEAMNVAARLMGAAAGLAQGPWILCDATTARRAAGRVAFEPMEAVPVKGMPDPVEVARPLRATEPALGLASATVGRHAELRVIRQTLRATAAGAARCSTLVIGGEAGIGKSRLAAELAGLARDMGVDLWSGHGDAVEAGTVLFPWFRIFAGLLGIGTSDNAQQRRKAVERWLGPELAPRAPLLGALFSLGGAPDTPQTLGLSGSLRAKATCELMVACLQRVSSQQPSCVLLEDAHWFDPWSWALAVQVSQQVPRLQLVLTMRPLPKTGPQEWAQLRSLPQCTQLWLQPLSRPETHALVCQRLGATALALEVQSIVETRCGGHPFVAEELASSLAETGVVRVTQGVCQLADDVDVQHLAIPKTTQGLLTARIDHLRPQAQLVLKVASVIGMVIPTRLLYDIHPVPSDLPLLPELLEELRQAELLVATPAEGETLHAFNHILTLEVAYGLMLYAQRRQLHRSAAQWLERMHGPEHPEMLGLLAHHWRHAEEPARAIAYLEKSALRSFSLGFAAAAVEHSLQAARLLGVRLPRSASEIQEQLRVELVRIEELLGGRHPEALLELAPLRDQAVDASIALLLRMEPAVHVSGQDALFALIALRCMALTLEHGNGPQAALAYAMFSIVYAALGQDRRRAFDFSRLALVLDRRQGSPLFTQVTFIHYYFHAHWLHSIGEGLDEMERAADAGFASGDLPYACFNNSAQLIALAYAGRPLQEVMSLARRNDVRNGRRVMNAAYHCVLQLQIAKALAGRTARLVSLTDEEYDEQRHLAVVRGSELHEESGWYHASKLRLHVLAGELQAALQFVHDGAALLPAIAGQPVGPEFTIFHALTLLGLANPAGSRLDAPQRAAHLEQAHALVRQIRDWAAVGPGSFLHRLLVVEGELAAVQGDLAQAARHFHAAADAARAVGHLFYEGFAHERCAAHQMPRAGACAASCLRAARSAYARWGAQALLAGLDARYGADGA